MDIDFDGVQKLMLPSQDGGFSPKVSLGLQLKRGDYLEPEKQTVRSSSRDDSAAQTESKASRELTRARYLAGLAGALPVVHLRIGAVPESRC